MDDILKIESGKDIEGMVSMKDIAKECQVSIATVSKALNNQSDISEEKKAVICKTAEVMGYRPNLFARTLKTHRSYNIGVLFIDEANNGLTHDYFAAILESFKVTVEQNDYDLTFLNCNKLRKNRMSYLEHALYRGFDGVAIACVNFDDPEVIELVQSDIPVVTIDYVFNDRLAVLSDNTKGMEELVSYVCQMGHQRIAYVHGEDGTVTRNRLSAYLRVIDRFDIAVNEDYIVESRYRDPAGAASATAKLLNLKVPPTCILYPDDFAAFGGINEIRDRGLSISEDISVAGYDGIRLARHSVPKLTTLVQDTASMGKCAAEKLIALIENPKVALKDISLIKGDISEGQTVKRQL